MSNDLIETLDRAAQALLARAGVGDKVSSAVAPEEGSDSVPTLQEQIQAFQAAMKWAELRPKLIQPDAPKASKADELRAQFHGTAPQGRRRGRPPAESDALDS